MFQQVLDDLQSFVSKIKDKPIEQFQNEIQTAILLTGNIIKYICIIFLNLVTRFMKLLALQELMFLIIR